MRDAIQEAIAENPVILFMKGNPGRAGLRLLGPHRRRSCSRWASRSPRSTSSPTRGSARSSRRCRTGRRSRSCSSTASSSAAATSSPRCTSPASSSRRSGSTPRRVRPADARGGRRPPGRPAALDREPPCSAVGARRRRYGRARRAATGAPLAGAALRRRGRCGRSIRRSCRGTSASSSCATPRRRARRSAGWRSAARR